MNALLEQLIKIPSVSSDRTACRACLDFALAQFENCPVYIEKNEVHDVVSALVATEKTHALDVLFLIHLDVVPAPQKLFTPVVSNGRLYGRGAFDMKSSAAVAICVLKALAGKTSLKIGILFSTDEELGGTNGAGIWTKKKNLTAKVVIDPDSSQSIDALIVKTKKPLFVRLTATGKAVHGSRPWLGVDANEALFQTIYNLRKIFPAYDIDSPHVPNEGWIDTMHVGMVQGGKAANMVADEAVAELDFRLIETTQIADVMAHIERVKNKNITAKITTFGNAVVLDQTSPVVSLYVQTVENMIGKPMQLKTAFGATDGRYFADKSIVLTHQATGANGHQDDEWVDLNSIHQLYEIQMSFLKQVPKFLKD